MCNSCKTYADLLGEPIDSAVIASFIERTGARLDHSNGDFAVIECPDHGVTVCFKPELQADTKCLVATSVQLFSKGAWRFEPFEGELPFGCAFGVSPDAAHRRVSDSPAERVTLEEDASVVSIVCLLAGVIIWLECRDRRLALVTLMLETAIPVAAR
jgi:hypothetical protein